MASTDGEKSVTQFLTVLEKKTTDSTERLNCYTGITKNFKEDSAKVFGEEIIKEIARVLAVIKTDVSSSPGNVTQSALEVLGVCLHDLEIVKAITDDEGDTVLQSLCECIRITEDKNTCTRALWCIGKQNLTEALIQKQVGAVLTAVEYAIEKWKGSSVTVEHESVNTIARLTEQASGEMEKEGARWGKVLLPLVSHSAVKVRDRVLTVIEASLPLMGPQRKDLVTSVIPVFKSKVIPELKKLLGNKQELYALKCWAVLVQLFGEELHHGSFINHLLPVVEMGFKSVSQDVKIESFRAWQQLIDNFALSPNILGDPKRIKLIMQVFKLNNAKTEAVALVKHRVWWHFIWMLGNKISTNFDMVAVPFLQFCVGGSKLIDQANGSTPRGNLKPGTVSSPATPRMNLTAGGSTQLPVFKPLQISGCEALALMLGLPDFADFEHHFKLDPLVTEVVTGPSFLIKQSAVFITTTSQLFTSLGKDLPECLVLHIWHWLIAHLKNAIDSPLKLDIRETLNTLLSNFQIIILSRVLSASVLLSMLRGVCQLPRKVLCSTAYGIKGEKTDKTVNGTPALFLMELLLTPVLLQACYKIETYHELFISIVNSGLGNSTCTLGFLQSVMEMLARNAEFVEEKETLWRLWSTAVSPLMENITKTSEVNQGDALEPNFDGTVQALTFPIRCKLHDMPGPSQKTMLKTWTDLYKTVDRLAAMVTNAEANVVCESVCSKVLEHCRSDKMDGAEADMLAQFCHVIVSTLDYSSLDTQSAFNLGYSPKKLPKKRHRPLENINSLVSLLVQLQNTVLDLAAEPDTNKKPSSTPTQGIFNTLVDIFSVLFTHLTSSFIIGNMLGSLSEPLGRLFRESAKKTIAKVYNNAFQQKLEKLWLDMCTCLQSRYTGMYDTEFLKKLSPLLESTFLHSRRQIKNQTVAFWASTFSKAASLEYPEDLRMVLTKVKDKSTIQLPGWVAMASPVIEETPISQMSQSQAPEPRIPGMPSPHKIHGSILNKPVSPNVKRSPLRSPVSPKPIPRTNSAKKKMMGWADDDKDFVVIRSSPKKKMVLTDHQREVMKEKRVFPAMYNSLEISQDVSLMAAHFSGDTQMSNTSTPTPTLTQPFSLFGSIVPPTAEQGIESQSSTQEEKTSQSADKVKNQPNSVDSTGVEDSAMSKCRRSVRFKEKNESGNDGCKPTKALPDTGKQNEVVVIEESQKMDVDKLEPAVRKIASVDLTKDSQESTDKDSSSKDSSLCTSIPQNVLGVVGFSQLTSSKSSQSKSSKSSEDTDSPIDKLQELHTMKESGKSNSSILDSFGDEDDFDNDVGITSSEPLLSWTQKLSELSQSPGLKSPVKKALSQDSRSPKRSGSPHKSPRRNRKKLTNENEKLQVLDKWVLRSPVKSSEISGKISQDIVVASVTGTFVEETQSPTKFSEAGKNDKMSSIMETPPKNILEDLSVSHSNSSRKLFNSQSNNPDHDIVEDSNIVPASPNSKSFTMKTGTPILKVKRLTEQEIKRYSPSRGDKKEEEGTPSGRNEKHRKDKAKCNINLEKIDSKSHEHDDFSEFKPLENEVSTQNDLFEKSMTDSDKEILNLVDEVESKETPSLFTQDIEPTKTKETDADSVTMSQESQDSSGEEVGSGKSARSHSRKQETPKRKSPQDKQGRKKKTELVMSATKSSKRIKNRREKTEVTKEDIVKNNKEQKESQDIFSQEGNNCSPINEQNMDAKEMNTNSVCTDMEVESVPLNESLDGTELMDVDEFATCENEVHDAKLDKLESKKVENKMENNKTKTEPKKRRGRPPKSDKIVKETQGTPDMNRKQEPEKKIEEDKEENGSVIVSQNTPEAKISPKQPERCSTTKRKKAVAKKMVLKRAKDIGVSDGDSNVDDNLSDEDVPKLDVKKIVGESLQKKLEGLQAPEKDLKADDVKNNKNAESDKNNPNLNDKVQAVSDTMENENTVAKESGQENENSEENLESDDNVPLISIKEKIDKKITKKKKHKSKKLSEPQSPVGSKLRSSKVKVTRLRSGEKKGRTSPQSKKSVKLAVKRARSLDTKYKLSNNNDNDINTPEPEQNVKKDDTLASVKKTDIDVNITKDMDSSTGSVTASGLSNDNGGVLAVNNKKLNGPSVSGNLNETPKKGIEVSCKSSVTVLMANSDSKLILGSRKFDRKNVLARRSILKPSSLGSTGEVSSPKRRDFHPITVGHIYSPTASPSASILKKRRLTDDSGSETNSPPAKQRRVSFADPIEAERSRAKDVTSGSPLVTNGAEKSREDSMAGTPTSSLRTDTQSTQGASQSQASYHSTQESQLNTTDPVCPGLQSCDQSVEKVLPQLTSSMWSRGLGQLMRARNIQTIGHLSALTEGDIQSLPIRSPKVLTVKKALEKFNQNQKARAVKLWGPSKTESAPSLQKSGEANKEIGLSKSLVEKSNPTLESGGISKADKDINPADIENILTSSGDLIDEVNKLSQTYSQSQSKESSCDIPTSQLGSRVGVGAQSTSNEAKTGTTLLETLKSLYGNDGDGLKGLRVDELFQAHQYLSNLQNQVVNTLKTRCHSPSNS